MRIPAVALLAVAALSSPVSALAQRTEGPQMALEYGFRHDPMDFVEHSDALDAALVRKHVFEAPQPADADILQAEIERILAQQRDDGMLAEDLKGTADRMLRLIELGVYAKRPEVQRVAELLLAEKCDEEGDNFEQVSVRGTRALILMGFGDRPEVRAAVQTMVRRQEVWNAPWKLCPWGQMLYMNALWDGRQLADTTPAIAKCLTWMTERVNAAGLMDDKDPWGLVEAAGNVALPEAKALLSRLLPLVLRGQQPDGGWGDHSLVVFRALVKHELFDRLRERPPLPPDWRVVRDIPVPECDFAWMACDGDRLWLCDRDVSEAVAISAEDGSVLQRLGIHVEGGRSINWWNAGLGVVQEQQKRLVKLDPNTGAVLRDVDLARAEWPFAFAQVGDELWLYDPWFQTNWRVDPDDPEAMELFGVAGGGHPLVPTSDGVWQMHDFAPVMVLNGPDRRLVDWAEKPFGDSRGLASDGQHLWALDPEGGRICAIERTAALDHSAVELRGNGMKQDPFSLTVEAAARLLGVEADYDAVYAMSTNAFAPGLDPGENCMSWWRTSGQGLQEWIPIDIVAGRFGLSARRLPFPEWEGYDETQVNAYNRTTARIVRDAMNRSEVVITGRGWEVRGPYGFNPWCWWGIITEARDDGTTLGACLNGHLDNPRTDCCAPAWALLRADVTLTPEEAHRRVLSWAVARIRGDEPFDPQERYVYGLQALDLWIEQMQEVPYCSECGDQSWTCAADTARPVYEGARVAAAYLRGGAAALPEGAREHVATAAAHYDRIAALLRPAIEGEGRAHYRGLIGNADAQALHVETVLRPVRDELAAAADAMQRALDAF